MKSTKIKKAENSTDQIDTYTKTPNRGISSFPYKQF